MRGATKEEYQPMKKGKIKGLKSCRAGQAMTACKNCGCGRYTLCSCTKKAAKAV